MTKQIIEVGILGATGRMGLAVLKALQAEPRMKLAAAISEASDPHMGQDIARLADLRDIGVKVSSDLPAALDMCDVLIDFSAPKPAIDAALAMHERRCHSLVTGTTGYTEVEEKALMSATHDITLLKSGNFSLGVNMLEVLVEKASRALRAGWDIEVLEMHHKHKVDAPSGTALMLGEAAAKGRDVNLKDVQVLTREGRGAPRAEGQIGFAALRGGGVIGAHEVRIASEMEMITLSHDALDRSVFARGAVAAALWAVGQDAGAYDMKDVLGL